MAIGDQVIKRFGFKRVYEVVSDPVKIGLFKYREVRKSDKLHLVMEIRLKVVKL